MFNEASSVKQKQIYLKKLKWYAVSNETGKCIKDEGPASFIKILQELKEHYEVSDDVIEYGIPIQVTVKVYQGLDGQAITYYRGKNLCDSVLNAKNSKKQAEMDKYQ